MKQTPLGKSFAASPIVSQINSGDVSFYWGNATLIYDDPKKASLQSDDPAHRLIPRLKSITDHTARQVIVVSPYFVPGKPGIEYFRKLRERGVRVVILTNSMASTDVLPVYAAYSKYRKELLAMGVELYEFKPSAVAHVGSENEDSDDAHSASFAGLHAKVFAFDRTSMFVGSFNLDPRSQRLNTEVGVVFDSADMAADLSDRFESRLMSQAWRVEAVPMKGMFGDDVRLNWVTQDRATPVRLTEEPGQGFWKNLKVGLMRMLPIESQL
jgi:putative cardiolipin synthase